MYYYLIKGFFKWSVNSRIEYTELLLVLSFLSELLPVQIEADLEQNFILVPVLFHFVPVMHIFNGFHRLKLHLLLICFKIVFKYFGLKFN